MTKLEQFTGPRALRVSQDPNPWLYFGLVFGWTWLFWLAAILVGQDFSTWPVRLLQYTGGVGPPLVAILLTYWLHGQEGWREFWRRVFQVRRIRGGWWLAVLFLPPLVLALAALFDRVLGGQGLAWTENATRLAVQPLSIVPVALFLFLFGPLPEELGWRGYALPGLQAKWSALRASLVLGFAWALWHLPLFWIAGSYQYELGVGTPLFWQFIANIIAQTILLTWIFNNTRQSTLSAILFHFMVNFGGELVALTPRAEGLQAILWAGAALLVVFIWTRRAWLEEHEKRNLSASTLPTIQDDSNRG
jgi:uncharacterized protein